MARIIGIDYGTKRIGLAVTDPLQIIANGLDTVPHNQIFDFLDRYIKTEEVEAIVIGEPMHLDGNPSQIAPLVNKFVDELSKRYPDLKLYRQDERFTSESAKDIILASGAKKKKRRDKGLIDKVSAIFIFQTFMESRRL